MVEGRPVKSTQTSFAAGWQLKGGLFLCFLSVCAKQNSGVTPAATPVSVITILNFRFVSSFGFCAWDF